MKQLLLTVLLVGVSSLLVGSLYPNVRLTKSEEACTMEWLSGQLGLNQTQYDKIWALHCELCPDADVRGDQERCRLATQALIDAVCAELTPVQRDKYLQLVAPCLAAGSGL